MYSDKAPFPRHDKTRREERLFDRGDAHGQRRRAYERKSRIFKRHRERMEKKPEKRILEILLGLEDKSIDQIEQEAKNILEKLEQDFESDGSLVCECFIDCVVELPSSTSKYAALLRNTDSSRLRKSLLGMLCDKHGNWVDRFLKNAVTCFVSALNESEWIRSRMILRYFVALVSSGALLAATVLSLLHKILDSAIDISQISKDPSGRSWQPYTDFLTYMVLIALPWGGDSLFTEADWNVFVDKVKQYIKNRPLQEDPGTCPFLAPIRENDLAAQSDSGGLSFVAELWTAIQEFQSSRQWTSGSIHKIPILKTENEFEKRTLAIEGIEFPSIPPGCSFEMTVTECAMVLHQRYPPRGGIQLLEASHTHPDASILDRIIVEEYILDILFLYQKSRVECIKRIKDIPASFPIFPLVAQTLFSQLLLLPNPKLRPVGYSSIIIHLCKVGDEAWSVFPRGLSACVREIFTRMAVLDPELVDRMADWLAIHLSNLGFMWPWQKWKKVIEVPDDDAQKQFVQKVLRNLVNLSYMKVVKESLSSEEFYSLLPPEPTPKSFEELFPSSKEDMEDPTDNDPDQMDVDVKVEAEGPSDEMSLWKRLHDCVVSKQSAESLRHNFENEISASYEEIQRFLKGMVRILLICGDKHIAHTDTILTRYQDVLKEIVAMIGAESEVIMIEAVFDIWQRSVHRIGLLLTLLMTKQWISSEGLIRWAFQKMQNDPEIDEETMEVLWHVIQNGIQFAESLVKDAENEKADAAIQVEYAKQRAHDAATQAALAASHVEYGTGDDVQSMLNAINEANQAEENARKELKEAENALQSMDGSHVQTAMDFFRRTLLEVLQGHLTLLKEKPDQTMDDSTDGKMSRRYYRILARLGAFCRRYAQAITASSDAILQGLESYDPLIRSVVLNSLRITKEDHSRPFYQVDWFVRKRSAAPSTLPKSDPPAIS